VRLDLIVESGGISEKTWNAALTEAEPQGTIFQSTYWADYLKKNFGDRPLYLASFDKKGEIQAQLLAFESCYSKHSLFTKSGMKGLLLSRFYKLGLSSLLHQVLPCIYWENGPVVRARCPPEQLYDDQVPYRDMVEEITAEAQRRNCYEIKFARPAFFNDDNEIFSSIGFQQKRMGTILVNLNQPLEAIWSRVDKDARRTVRRGIEQGISIAPASTLTEFKEFYELNVQTARRTNTKIYPFSYFVALRNQFSPLAKIIVLNAHIKERPVASGLFLLHNGIIHFFAIGESDYGRLNKIYGNEVLLWHIIKWGHEQGFSYFDLSGIELYKIDARDPKARQISRFKRKWGGEIVEYHDYRKDLRRRKLVEFLKPFIADSTIHN